MAVTPEQAKWYADIFSRMVDNVGIAVLGKPHVARLALTCLLSEGHLLLEDNPGTGKTSLAKAVAATVQGTQKRIQFTPDLLPSDVTGSTVYDQQRGVFEFRPGPIFASIVLADEINRASPKTQSALLQVMEEGRVTVDGTGHEVGRPFMIIATQNPIEQAGTYRLPEAQLDRFLMKTSVGYPDHDAAVTLISQSKTRDRTTLVGPVITSNAVAQMSALADEVHVDNSILGYVIRIAEASRRHPQLKLGMSVRGTLAYTRCAKTWALADGRDHVIPDDIKELAEPVLGHRLLLNDEAQFADVKIDQVIGQLFAEIQPPVERAA